MRGDRETFRYNVLRGVLITIFSIHHLMEDPCQLNLSDIFNRSFSNIYSEMNFLRDILIFILHSLSHKITFKTCSLQIVFAFKRQTSKTKLSGLPWIVSDNWSLNISFSYQCHFFSNVFSQCLFN